MIGRDDHAAVAAECFRRRRNSIFQNTRLMTPTIGLNNSSAHCGNIARVPRGIRSRIFFAGNVPVLFKSSELKLVQSLQRPLLVYELDSKSGASRQ